MAPPRKRAKLEQSPSKDNPDTGKARQNTLKRSTPAETEITKNINKGTTASESDRDVVEETFEVHENRTSIPCVRKGKSSADVALIFTHAAGGDLTATAMVNFMAGFSRVAPLICFKGAPSNVKSRAQAFSAVCNEHTGVRALGGRSMGARAAVMAVQPGKTNAVVLVSYPLTAPSGDVRDKILLDLSADVDVLFISGDNDKMCDVQHLNTVQSKMAAKSWLVIVQGADHGMTMKPNSATTEIGELTGRLAAEWLADSSKTTDRPFQKVKWDRDGKRVDVSGWLKNPGKVAKGLDTFFKTKDTSASQTKPTENTSQNTGKRKVQDRKVK